MKEVINVTEIDLVGGLNVAKKGFGDIEYRKCIGGYTLRGE